MMRLPIVALFSPFSRRKEYRNTGRVSVKKPRSCALTGCKSCGFDTKNVQPISNPA